MKKTIIILLCTVSMSICAADYLPFSAPMPMPFSTMTSVCQSSYMRTGSKYTPSVHEIDASSPIAYAPGRPRKLGGPGTIDPGTVSGDYDPQNTQFSPIGDAVIPLLIMALIYMIVAYRRKTKVTDLCV